MPSTDDKALARAIAIIIATSSSVEEIKRKFLVMYEEDGAIVKLLSGKNDQPQS